MGVGDWNIRRIAASSDPSNVCVCHIQYLTYEDTYLAMIGGSSVFEGVYWHVKLHNIMYPMKQLHTSCLKGIHVLSTELMVDTVETSPSIEPTRATKKSEPHVTIPIYTD